MDLFGERNIPVRNMERASGFIATQSMGIARTPRDSVLALADCGSIGVIAYPPNAVEYTVLVRGDTTSATVRTTARFTTQRDSRSPSSECASRGVWESAFEAAVKARAERH